jgi:hypothetical protein
MRNLDVKSSPYPKCSLLNDRLTYLCTDIIGARLKFEQQRLKSLLEVVGFRNHE